MWANLVITANNIAVLIGLNIGNTYRFSVQIKGIYKNRVFREDSKHRLSKVKATVYKGQIRT
jgi:uncharacterized protein with FMN-binding domain